MESNISYKNRIQSIDLLRGVVILLMALDHVRDFFGPLPFRTEDLLYTSGGIFFTRWITNLCAPTFILLTGISAYLYGLKVSKKELSFFLIKRGIFLIFLEMFVVSFAWSFKFLTFFEFQVVWVLGASMMILAGLIWLPRYLILIFSLAVIFGHNYFDASTFSGIIWNFLHIPFEKDFSGITIFLTYPLIPWFAVMALGYCIGHWMKEPLSIRNKKFMLLGASALFIFIVLRFLNQYGDPVKWEVQARGAFFTFLSFIKVKKYPPSLFYILETIGIITLLWPIWEKWQGAVSRFILCFGKVAMFFYLIHLFFIHLLAELYSRFYLHVPGGWWWPDTFSSPPGYQFRLWFVYLVWMAVIFMLYPLCRWYKQFKETHNYAWLKYL